MLLAAREQGYRSLMRLCSRAFLDTDAIEQPHIKLAWLDGEADGLIALTGGPGGPLDRAIARGPERDLAAIALRGACSACSATAFTSSCSVTAWRRSGARSRR